MDEETIKHCNEGMASDKFTIKGALCGFCNAFIDIHCCDVNDLLNYVQIVFAIKSTKYETMIYVGDLRNFYVH